MKPPPPRDEAELRGRVAALEGVRLVELAQAQGLVTPAEGAHTKGKVGQLVEAALGAEGGSAAEHDFPHLGVELKTIPLDEAGRARESTYVCTLPLADAEHAEWETSWARRKLSHVLWVPILGEGDARRVGRAVFWRPTQEQESVLRVDFEDIVGAIGMGAIDRLTARDGRWLQLRPKAAHGRVRTVAPGWDGEALETVPRGLYLRARFTTALLADPAAAPP
jgi:DNA mismatch repair protein MutH